MKYFIDFLNLLFNLIGYKLVSRKFIRYRYQRVLKKANDIEEKNENYIKEELEISKFKMSFHLNILFQFTLLEEHFETNKNIINELYNNIQSEGNNVKKDWQKIFSLIDELEQLIKHATNFKSNWYKDFLNDRKLIQEELIIDFKQWKDEKAIVLLIRIKESTKNFNEIRILLNEMFKVYIQDNESIVNQRLSILQFFLDIETLRNNSEDFINSIFSDYKSK